jgi:RNA polymerase sigma-70 factor, ECF subfamily
MGETPQEIPRPSDEQDRQWIVRAARGDSAAFHRLVDAHADRLFRVANSLVGNVSDAEDVLQETFAGAFKGLRGFAGRSTVKTWLTRILVLQVAAWRRKRRKTLPLEGAPERASGGGQAGVDARMDFQAAMEKLSPEHREVIVLRELEQMSYEEIAQALEVPRGTVESRLHRARAELALRLKSYLS